MIKHSGPGIKISQYLNTSIPSQYLCHSSIILPLHISRKISDGARFNRRRETWIQSSSCSSLTAVPSGSCPLHFKTSQDGAGGLIRASMRWCSPGLQSAVLSCCHCPMGEQPASGAPCPAHADGLHSSAPKHSAGRWGLNRGHSSGHSFKCESFAAQCKAASAFGKKP